jgi:hypothetical protein
MNVADHTMGCVERESKHGSDDQSRGELHRGTSADIHRAAVSLLVHRPDRNPRQTESGVTHPDKRTDSERELSPHHQ